MEGSCLEREGAVRMPYDLLVIAGISRPTDVTVAAMLQADGRYSLAGPSPIAVRQHADDGDGRVGADHN